MLQLSAYVREHQLHQASEGYFPWFGFACLQHTCDDTAALFILHTITCGIQASCSLLPACRSALLETVVNAHCCAVLDVSAHLLTGQMTTGSKPYHVQFHSTPVRAANADALLHKGPQ